MMFSVSFSIDFPNLPYLFDGDLKMTQSKPILFYLGRKFDLMGKSLVEEANVMMLCDEAHDLRMKMSMHFYGPNGGCETSRKEYFDANVRPNLKRFDEFLAKNSSKFSVGDSATVADFQLFDYLDVAFLMDGSEKASTDFPHIHVFLDHMRNLPELKDYILKSQATFPINAASKSRSMVIFVSLIFTRIL